MKQLTVGVISGGRSGEHEVSKLSAKNVIFALQRAGFPVVEIFIDKKGHWFVNSKEVVLLPSPGLGLRTKTTQKTIHIDIYFPVLHGTYGEDGTIQGLFEMAGVPYVGAGVLGSAIGMDKEAQKKLFLFRGIPTAHFEVIYDNEWNNQRDEVLRRVIRNIGLPCFVKPVNLGSSVGINKAKNEKTLQKAISEAFLYDTKILVEEYIKGREVLCAVIGNENPQVTLPGEVIPKREFYDYIAKYIADDTEYKVAIPLKPSLQDKIMRMAAEVYRVTFCQGMARIDFFLTDNEDLYVVEINTIPGFTSHSMFPRLWEASGMPFPEVVTELVRLGMDRWQKRQALQTSFKEGELLRQ